MSQMTWRDGDQMAQLLRWNVGLVEHMPLGWWHLTSQGTMLESYTSINPSFDFELCGFRTLIHHKLKHVISMVNLDS